jgi:hypothetical protein
MAGIISAVFFYQGKFIAGAIYFFLFAVLDCCDGMQARMKKNGSEFGRFVDGIVDYTCNAACYIGLGIGVSNYLPMTDSIPTMYLVIAAGLSKALHSITYDHFLMEYLSYFRGDSGFVQKELEVIREKIRLIKLDPNGSKRRLFILWIYLGFTSLQGGKENKTLKFNSNDYVKINHRSIQLWGFIGPAWHIAFLIMAFALNSPKLLFGYAIIFGNIWLIGMLIYQQRLTNELLKTSRTIA